MFVQVFQPWIENKRKEREMKKNLISEMLNHFQSNTMGSLLTDDGKPDTPAIKRLLGQISVTILPLYQLSFATSTVVWSVNSVLDT